MLKELEQEIEFLESYLDSNPFDGKAMDDLQQAKIYLIDTIQEADLRKLEEKSSLQIT